MTSGVVRVVNKGTILMEQAVEAKDIFRMSSRMLLFKTVKLAVNRARLSATPAVF
jgi:isocitrate dehydrogenase